MRYSDCSGKFGRKSWNGNKDMKVTHVAFTREFIQRIHVAFSLKDIHCKLWSHIRFKSFDGMDDVYIVEWNLYYNEREK